MHLVIDPEWELMEVELHRPYPRVEECCGKATRDVAIINDGVMMKLQLGQGGHAW
jgi:hypothetical protein